MTDATNFRPFAFVLAVPDLASSAAYFQDVLGFTVGWEDVAGRRLLSRGQVNLMIVYSSPTGEVLRRTLRPNRPREQAAATIRRHFAELYGRHIY